ncbi:MAG: hypothetical protein LBQ58_05980, partial [Synergistaceae bacterium]|nr:hypothetical protein [Synergistaceae bacterium]
MRFYKSKLVLAALALAALAMVIPGAALAAPAGSGTEQSPYIVTTGTELDEALVAVADDYYQNSEGQNISNMHYITLTADIDAITSATYGAEDDDHPVRVTIEGNGHVIKGVLPDTPPTHAGGNTYTGLRFANRTPFTETGRG